jgi:outer membrane protein TolC
MYLAVSDDFWNTGNIQNMGRRETVKTRATLAVVGGCLLGMLAAPAFAQTSGGGTGPAGPNASNANQGLSSSTVNQAQQQLSGASGTQSGAGVSQDDFRGSVVTGTATNGVIDLSLEDAIQRGLQTNLGIILQSSSVQNANGQRLEQLQSLLPTVSGGAALSVQQINLAAYGLKFPGLNPIIGPFQVTDFRAYLSQTLFNLTSLQNYLAAKHNFASAKFSAQDARDMVVLTVGNAYLLCVADEARVTAVKSELATSKLSLDQAVDAHDAGTSPRIDVLRAQVDYQNEQQSLISTTNNLEKDKLALARTIGLPLAQQFRLSDDVPYAALDNIDPKTAFADALNNRKDLQALNETVKASEAQKKAAWEQQLPQADVSGNFGDQGQTAGHSHGTYTVNGEVTAPILQIAKTHGDEQVAGAQYAQANARYQDQIQQVNADIQDSILDIQAAAKLVEATKSNVELATEALSEAQQRFHAGVSDNLPVSQAQTQTEQANDQYISALYQHNVAKLSLARALGVAQTRYKDYLGGK